MCKFALFKQVAAKERQARNESHEALCQERHAELMGIVAEVDIIMDRRRSRKSRPKDNYTGPKTTSMGNIIVYPPKGHTRLVEAAKEIGMARQDLTKKVKDGKIPGSKFNDPKNNFLNWYIPDFIVKQLKERKQKGLPLVPSVFLPPEK